MVAFWGFNVAWILSFCAPPGNGKMIERRACQVIFTVCHAVKLTLSFCSHGPVGRRRVDRNAILSPAR